MKPEAMHNAFFTKWAGPGLVEVSTEGIRLGVYRAEVNTPQEHRRALVYLVPWVNPDVFHGGIMPDGYVWIIVPSPKSQT